MNLVDFISIVTLEFGIFMPSISFSLLSATSMRSSSIEFWLSKPARPERIFY